MAGGSETAAQLFARLGSRPSLQRLCPHLFGEEFPKPGELIEFYGDSGTAKTECLLNFAATCILPPYWKGFTLGGIGCGVVFIDTQNQFSMLRAFTLLEKRVTVSINTGSLELNDVGRSCTSSGDGERSDELSSEKSVTQRDKPDTDEIEAFIKVCLEKLYIIRCNSSQQQLITLHSLDNFFGNRSDISVIMIDTWWAFYWKDRAIFGDQPSATESCQRRSMVTLKKLLSDHQLVAFLTRYSPLKATGKQDPQREVSHSLSATQGGHTESDLSHNELKKLASQRFTLERSAKVDASGNLQPIIKATRVYPKPSHIRQFCVSEKGISSS